jgi:hypothetical protein
MGTADKPKLADEPDMIGPWIAVFDGKDTKGMPVGITVFAGPAAVREDWDSRLLSTGGIQRRADDALTGHHVGNLELITCVYKSPWPVAAVGAQAAAGL